MQGIVQDRNGKTVATLIGKWDESMHYVYGDCSGKGKGSELLSEAHLLWKRSKPPKCPTRYNLTRFAITMNELTPGLKVRILFYWLKRFLFIYVFCLNCVTGKTSIDWFKAKARSEVLGKRGIWNGKCWEVETGTATTSG